MGNCFGRELRAPIVSNRSNFKGQGRTTDSAGPKSTNALGQEDVPPTIDTQATPLLSADAQAERERRAAAAQVSPC